MGFLASVMLDWQNICLKSNLLPEEQVFLKLTYQNVQYFALTHAYKPFFCLLSRSTFFLPFSFLLSQPFNSRYHILFLFVSYRRKKSVSIEKAGKGTSINFRWNSDVLPPSFHKNWSRFFFQLVLSECCRYPKRTVKLINLS